MDSADIERRFDSHSEKEIEWNTSANDWFLCDEGYSFQFCPKNEPIVVSTPVEPILVQSSTDMAHDSEKADSILSDLSVEKLSSQIESIPPPLVIEEVKSEVQISAENLSTTTAQKTARKLKATKPKTMIVEAMVATIQQTKGRKWSMDVKNGQWKKL